MPFRRLQSLVGAVAAAGMILLQACAPAQVPPASNPASVHADVAFTCLWWSEAQMEGLNPNTPPPKNTEVKITKWEYTDPVGVPHPDTVDVVVTLTSTDNMKDLVVDVSGEWKNGPLQSAASAAWAHPAVLKQFQGVSVGPSGAQTLRVPVDVKGMMESLGKQQKWPYELRTTIVVHKAGSEELLAKATASLPIKAGD
jgi:hypothetical protein